MSFDLMSSELLLAVLENENDNGERLEKDKEKFLWLMDIEST